MSAITADNSNCLFFLSAALWHTRGPRVEILTSCAAACFSFFFLALCAIHAERDKTCCWVNSSN